MHCLVHTSCKLVLLDRERMERVAHGLPRLRAAGVSAFVVFDAPARDAKRAGMHTWTDAMGFCPPYYDSLLHDDRQIAPEDDATIIFTSGT